MDWIYLLSSPLRTVDAILRHQPSGARESRLSWMVVLGAVVFCGLVYGTVMGSHAWVVGKRSLNEQGLQMFYSAIKVPLLLGVTTSVALPSFFVFNTILGLRDDFGVVMRSILSVQAGLTIILASLAPITLFFYVSSPATQAAYQSAILFNAMMFGTASVSAQLLLRVYYRPLIVKNPLHRRMLWVWIGLYAFVGIQCGWILRPFIGDHQLETAFFRKDKFGNAYVKVWEMVCDVFLNFF